MERISRGQLVGMAVGAGVATTTGAAYATSRPRVLERTIRSNAVPPVVVSVPGTWTVCEQLITNLVRPRQLLAVSNVALQPDHNPDEGFLPSLDGLGDTGVLLMVYGDVRDPSEVHAPRLPAEDVRLEWFQERDDGVPGFQWWLQWFESERFTYTVSLWVGQEGDATTARSVTESLRLV